MTSPPAYTVTAPLFHGSKATLYRAIREADGRAVVLKVLDPRRSRPKDLEQLRHEYEIGTQLRTPAVVKALALDSYQGMPALVLEDFGGQPLDELLGAPMAPARFLPLAVGMAGAVAALHREGVVHKDLKPHNVLLNPATGELKLTDLGLASRLPREPQPAHAPRLIEGSLPYLAPEQTGRTNRVIDDRTDLYSLGVTFYQMLTARLPFEARDAAEWVHCHVARAPPSPAEAVPGLPEPITGIVLKLLSKMPEDRYQSARGLRLDCERCLAEWREHGRIEPFPLGEQDFPGRLQIPQKLYGREAEIGLLVAAFERVAAAGTPELLMVSGYSGIGKSALVRELHRPIVRERGTFIAGKFDQYKRDIPYSTLVQAFRELVLEVLAESEERIADLRRRLLDALGINAQLIVDAIPPVELVLGPQPAVAELPPTEAQNRFRMVFRRFIGVFAQAEHPLGLFLDDLQWADSASLALLTELVAHPEMHHLLVIGAYRDNEVSAAHPLLLTLDEARRAGARLSAVVLGPIAPEHLAAFVGDALRCRREDAAPLADLVHDKTAGNPFFAIQFLTTLHEERLIDFDAGAGVFRWDVARIREKGFTDNVVELMAGKLGRLPASTRQALEQLACLGSTADAAFLSLACGRPEQELHADLREAVAAGLVLHHDGAYRFLHDRVQEAAYSSIPEVRRAEAHLRLGRRLLAGLSEEEIAPRLFEVVSQLNPGIARIEDPAERDRLCRLDALAGARAKAAIAYASARSYYAHAVSLLAADAWSARHDDTLALHLDLAECEYLVGDFQRADALFDLLLANAASPFDRARVHRSRARLYQIAGRFDEAVTITLEALRLLGLSIPEAPEAIAAAAEAERRNVPLHLRGRRIADIASAPQADGAAARAIIGLLAENIPLVYIARPELWPLISALGVNFSLAHGNAEESSFVYSCYAMVLASVEGDIAGANQFSEMAMALNEHFPGAAARLRGKLLFHHGAVIGFWSTRFAAGLPLLDKAFVALLEAGDLVFAGYLSYNAVWLHLESGEPLDHVLQVARRFTAFARQTHNDVVYHVVLSQERFAAALAGAREAGGRADGAFDEPASLAVLERAAFGVGIGYYRIMKQIAAFLGRRGELMECAESAEGALREVASMAIEAAHHFFHALAITACYPQAPPERQAAMAAALAGHLGKLAHWARSCPENFQSRHALVAAEIARIEGREAEAMRLYRDAVRAAQGSGLVHNEAMAYELAADFYRARGFDQIADMHLREARACYARWGAGAKVRQIDQRSPRLRETGALPPTATLAVRPEQLDLLSVTKASQTISGEIILDNLVQTLLAVVLEQGGGERAHLLLCQDSALSIHAEAALADRGAATGRLGPLPADLAQRLPLSLIHYVRRTRERVILDNAAADPGRLGGDAYFARVRPRSVLCMPVLRRAEVVGVLYLENNLLTGAFTAERLTALELLATQAAISLENALLLAKEQAARAAAEAAERRAAFLAEAGALLSESLDHEATFARLGLLCARSLASWCVIDIVDGQDIRRLAGAHADPAKEPLLRELLSRYPPRWSSRHPASEVLRTGQPLLMPDLPDDALRARCDDDAHFHLLRRLGTRSGLAVPLVSRGQTLGVLTLSTDAPGRRYGPADLELGLEVARRAGNAIDNARLYHASQEAVRLRSEFLTVASHELNTPVASLMLAVQSLRRAAPGGRPRRPETMDRLLEIAERQGVRLTKLVEDLLDVSRLDSQTTQLDLADFDLGLLAREVLDRFDSDFARAECAVSLSDPGGVLGRWDRSRLDRVLTNLLSNALKFGAGKPVEIAVSEAHGVARLTVRDHGIGIDPSEQARIFGRFERAVSEQHYGGLGLGLYICRRIVEDHGGSIRCESQLERGATFTVDLPCAQPLSPALPLPAGAEPQLGTHGFS